jgi:hypothetical protein
LILADDALPEKQRLEIERKRRAKGQLYETENAPSPEMHGDRQRKLHTRKRTT